MIYLLKSKKELMMIGLAAICGLCAIVLVGQYIEPVPTIVANQNIKAGTVVHESMLTTDRIAKGFRYAKAISPDYMHKIIGFPISVTLQAGDPILWSHFVQKNKVKGMADLIEKGKRAISIPFDTINSVSGNINVNDKIDILFTYKDRKTGGKVTCTLLQNKQVLSTGIRNKSANGALTLSLDPNETEMLIFAQHRGYMTASLRNPEDIDIIKAPPVNFDQLMKFLGTLPPKGPDSILLDENPRSINNTPQSKNKPVR